ncbi:MAG: ATP-binding cassette domain-containing protein [Endomicrobiales bacterium]|jgi:ABC-2 type transport system ATP-binding protein
MITVDRVTRKYGNFTAVDRVSFELKAGEIVGFLGPNGSGKTTLLRVMTTYLLPTEGRVTIDGLDVIKDSLEIRRRIGYLPESNILYPQMRVDEYLTFVGKVRGLKGARLKERFDWCVQSLMLQEVLHKKTMECSKGFKQRVSLCAALIHDPTYIILDEPTVGLDPLQIFMMRDFLRMLAKEKTILFSSHILQEVAAIAPRVIIIHEGRIIADVPIDAQDNRTERLEKMFEQAVKAKEEVHA